MNVHSTMYVCTPRLRRPTLNIKREKPITWKPILHAESNPGKPAQIMEKWLKGSPRFLSSNIIKAFVRSHYGLTQTSNQPCNPCWSGDCSTRRKYVSNISVCAAFLPTEPYHTRTCPLRAQRQFSPMHASRGYKCEPNLLNSHFAFQHQLQMTMGKWECMCEQL